MKTVRLIGVPTDRNSSFLRGAAGAPAPIRAQLFSSHGNLAAEVGGELGGSIGFHDAGDLPLLEDGGDDAIITASVVAALVAGEAPLLLGGDHAVTFPIVQAIAAHHGPVSILHFDAHPDLYDDFEGNPRSHASPFARIMEAGLATRLVQVGIRTMNDHCRDQAARFGVEVLPMRGFRPDQVPRLSGPVYISIDLDGLDPAFAPGVSHHEPGGLTVREVLDVLAAVEAPVVGADIVEYNPLRDINDMTAVVAAKLVKELAALLSR
ncbi:agmatinase [Sandarakinorhabdus sp. DWP1-3-1]|uniref:agmatinase n=1 Tax=Sandarakinorhabdus sp. DWP1-3-1 TaxID=2804627 RepID=UPI003CFA5DC0